MAEKYQKYLAMNRPKGLSQLIRAKPQTAASNIRFRNRVTGGLGATHGLKKFSDGTNLNALLEKVSNYAFKEYFLDFDRLRKGVVSEARFRSAIGNVNVEFFESHIQELLARYSTGTGMVDYTAFWEDVNKLFRREETAATLGRSKGKLANEEAKLIYDCLNDIRSCIKSNRILLKPSFADFDKTNIQRITVQQFSRVLKQLHLMPSEEVFDLICQQYFDKGNTREVNYVKFCHDVDRPEDMLEQLGLDYEKHSSGGAVKEEKAIPEATLSRTKSNFFAESTKGINVLENRFSKPTINLSNDPNDIEYRIQTEVLMKRVRIGEFFRDYDKLRKGKVTPSQFKVALSILNFKMTDEEYDTLTQRYKTDDGMVNYAAFVDNIDSAFTIKGIDKKPSVRVVKYTPKTILQMSRKHLEFDKNEIKAMVELMEEYRSAVKVKCLNLKPMFQDFDKTRSGHVTKSQFVRVLNMLSIGLPEHLLSLVLKKYMDKGNADEVNYFDFINDVDKPEDMFGAGRDFNHSYDYFSVTDPRKVETQIVKLQPEDINDVLSRIRRHWSQNRIRLDEFFRDFDKLRSGRITNTQFRTGMSMVKFDLSQSEFDILCTHYAADKINMMRWRDLWDDVDKIFTLKGIEKDATKKVDLPSIVTKYGQMGATKYDSKLAENLVKRFKEKLLRERLDAKSFFQSWDKHNRYKVSPKQFRQVLATFGFDLTDKENQALWTYYSNQEGEIEYLRFLKDANPEERGAPEETKKWYQSKGWRHTGITDYEALMLKIKNIVKKGRIRLMEYFQDHDTLRKGYVPYMKFKGVLRSQNIELTDVENEILLNKFKISIDSRLIDYVDFTEEIDRIFTKKGLEKEPTTKLVEFKPINIIDPDDVLTDAEEDVLEACLRRLGAEVYNRRLLLKPFFQDKDKIRCGVVVNLRFRSIFDMLKLPLTDEEYEIINKRFMSGAPNEINYLDFDNLLKRYSGDDTPF
jgi:Ca2+-binding EF-hand superfamily protein